MDYELGIILALKEEFTELFQEIKGPRQVHQGSDGNYYYVFEYTSKRSNRRWRCVATFIGEMGPVRASLATRQFVNDMKPRILILLGIAGAFNSALRLGDVVVADQVDAYLENSKAMDEEATDAYGFGLAGQVYRGSVDLLRFARNFQFAYPQLYRDWQEQCKQELATLFPEEQRNKLKKRKLMNEEVRIFEGHLASGSIVSASQTFLERLRRRDRSYLALDMEAAGLLAAVHEQVDPVRTLILRSISDYGDKRKAALDRVGEGAFRRYAIRNVVHLLWGFLEADFPLDGDPAGLPFSGKESNEEAVLSTVSSPVELLYFYVSADQQWRNQIAVALAPFKQNGLITHWYDYQIETGADASRTPEQAPSLPQAQITLVLLSPSFLASQSSKSPQIEAMIARHFARVGLVVPILLSKIDLQQTLFAKLPCLPTNGKPVNEWTSPPDALLDIAQGIRRMVADFGVSSA
jgi:nucleoside phosphorylase